MTAQKNYSYSHNNHAQTEKKSSSSEADHAAKNIIDVYNSRSIFFKEAFIKKVKAGNRKALAELQRHPMPPTPMDLRPELAGCIKAKMSDDHLFTMADGRSYTMKELKVLVPEWAAIASNALMESDPALADKLMSRAQWDAKAAFEVTFLTATNELEDIRTTKLTRGSLDQYMKWTIIPLEKALKILETVNPPGNSLIGFVNKIPLSEAISKARELQAEFRKALGEENKFLA